MASDDQGERTARTSPFGFVDLHRATRLDVDNTIVPLADTTRSISARAASIWPSGESAPQLVEIGDHHIERPDGEGKRPARREVDPRTTDRWFAEQPGKSQPCRYPVRTRHGGTERGDRRWQGAVRHSEHQHPFARPERCQDSREAARRMHQLLLLLRRQRACDRIDQLTLIANPQHLGSERGRNVWPRSG